MWDGQDVYVLLGLREELVKDGESILFVAPSIALVSQARREWLKKTRASVEEFSCVFG